MKLERGVLRQETSGSVFPGVVRLTAVIHRDRLQSTSPAENRPESDRWKTSGWEQREVNLVVPSSLLTSAHFFISVHLSRQNHSLFFKVQCCWTESSEMNLIFNITVETVNYHFVLKL